MEAKGFVVPPGQGRVWEMAAGRSSALKLLGGETGESVMMFEETAPSGTETTCCGAGEAVAFHDLREGPHAVEAVH
jgi:hypothetical protein